MTDRPPNQIADELAESLAKKVLRANWTEQFLDSPSGKPLVTRGKSYIIKTVESLIADGQKLKEIKARNLLNAVNRICECGGELTSVGCAHCNLWHAVHLAQEICNSKLFDENREDIEFLLDKGLKYKEHLDATAAMNKDAEVLGKKG